MRKLTEGGRGAQDVRRSLVLGEHVLVEGRPGRVGALSGGDQMCIVRFESERYGLVLSTTGWIPQEKAAPVPAPRPVEVA